MEVELKVSPHKSAGQGFGSATNQYLDVYIKFNTQTLTGYGLRIERTVAFGNGVRFTLMQFENGVGSPISDYVDSSVFLVNCTINLRIIDIIFTANVTNQTPQQTSQVESGLSHTVDLTTDILTNVFGGFGVQHTGNRTMLANVKIITRK